MSNKMVSIIVGGCCVDHNSINVVVLLHTPQTRRIGGRTATIAISRVIDVSPTHRRQTCERSAATLRTRWSNTSDTISSNSNRAIIISNSSSATTGNAIAEAATAMSGYGISSRTKTMTISTTKAVVEEAIGASEIVAIIGRRVVVIDLFIMTGNARI